MMGRVRFNRSMHVYNRMVDNRYTGFVFDPIAIIEKTNKTTPIGNCYVDVFIPTTINKNRKNNHC